MNDIKNRFEERFLILGDNKKIQQYINEKKLKKKIRRDQRSKLPGIWGTLGWKDDKPFNLKIQNSKEGNKDEERRDISTIEILNELKGFNSEIANSSENVVERYINFDNTDFGIDWDKIKTYDEIPELRLDLFVDDTEGAVVYYYHQQKVNFGQLDDDSVFEEFIQCEKTDDNYTTKRDRLTYYFKALPPKEYTVAGNKQIIWEEEERSTSFIVKIITFKREQKSPTELLDNFFKGDTLKQINTSNGDKVTSELFGKNKYGLLIYDNEVLCTSVASGNKNRFDMRGIFYTVNEEHQIDRSKKTLLLIHGTFSNTLNTFGHLVKFKNGSSELEDFLKLSQYEQVIAFNHPTISADVFDNIEILKLLLGTEMFDRGVSLLAASRGCLLAQAIGADKDLPFKVDKCLMFSPANGVDYFKFGEHVATGLSILKKVASATAAKYALALAQFSADYFLEQPGAQQMTPGNEKLTKVLNLELANPESQYTAVVNDWEKGLIDKRGKRFWMQIVDATIKLILGNKHDFVVGIKGQKNLPDKYNISQIPMASTHCKYFEKSELHERNGDEVILSSFLAKIL